MNEPSDMALYRPSRKSDGAIVPQKQANKAPLGVAEPVEGRTSTKRNTRECARDQTQGWANTMSRLARVRESAVRHRKQAFTTLLHHVTPTLLEQSFFQLKRTAAEGVDGISWSQYEEGLDNRLSDLCKRIQDGSYRPKPARRVYIPKADGSKRPLSILRVEDKIAQQAVVTILNQIYETDFMGFSYGFRPQRSQHDALDALAWSITRTRVNWVLDVDIRQFFDTVEHEWLIRMIRHRVQDKRLIKLIIRWIKVGITDDTGKRHPAQQGIPQGSVISPLLANIYLHYVFDIWSHQWRRKKAKGTVTVVRYADDVVLGFQHEWEAREYLGALNQRLQAFGLATHPEKTRLIRFGRFAAADRAVRGEGKPETFDFLGFTHYCTTCRQGDFKLGRKTSSKRLIKQIQEVKRQLRIRMHFPVNENLEWLNRVIRGHVNYYGVPGNSRAIGRFRLEIVRRWMKLLRRRSQRSRLNWTKFSPWVDRHLAKARICHPYPEQRLRAKYSR
ncbi:MAG: group II intron reverse transcriptase/maturase [Candidatus Thiodiazotropha sp. (ex Ctena orbiculata)]|nr:group II intron reverse transcriptase/maturase [Candidatus Thiodiazotropha taylori]